MWNRRIGWRGLVYFLIYPELRRSRQRRHEHHRGVFMIIDLPSNPVNIENHPPPPRWFSNVPFDTMAAQWWPLREYRAAPKRLQRGPTVCHSATQEVNDGSDLLLLASHPGNGYV